MRKAARRLLKLLWLTWALGFAGVLFAQTAPPVAPLRNVVDDYFGTKITDPYRWMEDMNSPEFQAWMKAQNDYTRVVIDSIPGRQNLLKSIVEYDNARTSVADLSKYGERYFYRKIEPDQDNFKLYMRDAKTGQERMLVDPDRFKPANETAHYALDYIYPSWDGKYVACGTRLEVRRTAPCASSTWRPATTCRKPLTVANTPR